MAIYKLFPEKDATLYSQFPAQNTGLDSILEASTYYIPTETEVSRFLIKFAQSEIEDIINNKISGSVTDATGSLLTESRAFESNLRCFIANVDGLSLDTTLEVYPVAGTWNMGTGKKSDTPKTENGCSWKYRLSSGSGAWLTEGFGSNITGSSPGDKPGGGNWYHGSGLGLDVESTQSLSYSSDKDININVTSIIQKFSSSFYTDAVYPDAITNNGFIIKKPSSVEEDSLSYGELSYFSTNTHTIYPPKLTFKWDDSSYSHSGTTLTSGDIFLSLYNNKSEFQRKSKQRFRLTTRKRYPDRTFVTSSNYLDINYLPETSYYSVRDVETDEVIIPFDTEYTKLSANSEGMYFDLWMEGFQPERYYKLMFRVDNNDGINIYDEDYFFKVVR